MRFSTVLSFLVALMLAGAAVYGTQVYMEAERQQLSAAALKEVEREEAERRTIVVANEPFSLGERISVAKLREIEWQADVVPEGYFEKIDEVVIGDSDAEARFAKAYFAVGAPILKGDITAPGEVFKMSTALTPGKKAVTIRVNDVLGVAGFVTPKDRVDVLLTRGRGGGARVDVLLQGLKVLAIGQNTNERSNEPSVVRNVTFEVNTYEAQMLTLGTSVGTLSLILRNLSDVGTEEVEPLSLVDLLNDGKVATSLQDDIQGRIGEDGTVIAAADPADAEVEVVAEPTEEQKRLTSMEELLKNLTQRLEEGQKAQQEPTEPAEPVIVEKEVVKEVVVEKIIQPKRTTVGVIRNGGQRSEYKVDLKGTEEEVILGGDSEQLPTE